MDRKKLKRIKNKEYLDLIDKLLGYESRILRETIRVLKDELNIRKWNYYKSRKSLPYSL